MISNPTTLEESASVVKGRGISWERCVSPPRAHLFFSIFRCRTTIWPCAWELAASFCYSLLVFLTSKLCMSILVFPQDLSIYMKKYCSGPVRISYNANLVFHSVSKKTRCKQKLALSFSLPFNYLTILFFSSTVRNSYLARQALSLSASPYNFLPSYAFWR